MNVNEPEPTAPDIAADTQIRDVLETAYRAVHEADDARKAGKPGECAEQADNAMRALSTVAAACRQYQPDSTGGHRGCPTALAGPTA